MATQVSTVTEVPFGPPSVSAPGKAIDASAHTYLQSRDTVVIPPSELQPHCHHLEKHVTEEVNAYFLKHWRFPNEKSRKKFVHAGFSTVTCWYFPTALNDRIHFACRLLTLLFLIDDLLEHMSLAEGEAYNNKLMPIARGDVLPDRHVPVEYIMYDLWESMRACDREMANQVLEPVFTFMRAQTDPTRLRPMDLKEYFEYRERDVGKGLLAALMRFCMGLRMSTEELAIARPVDMNCSKHLSIINDIWSFEKELLASKTAHKEGGALCTGVAIFAEGAEVSTSAAKRVLYALCREWEERHKELEAEALAQRNTPELRAYLKGLEHQMSGNEMWSRTTLRYRDR
ncbi:Aristolochene synthase in complex with 12,13 Difluorofarnesyl diphosphate [Decorospora gaudefroyi]|uniref:Terpene synthase n=1 Tax=Decorospora gaudefroyi TaxID=184978 RepID=A0A6A5JWV9_9PLEO|nr:Aristolochene synthase in complex with 12,13 Difluorofarnesyl diphosphate [Decorospora gaudefroyi]